MSYHILHLLSRSLKVRLKLDQLEIIDIEKGTERTMPLADIAVIVAMAPDLTVTAGALRRMAELNVVLLVSVYARPCGSADRVDTHVRRLKSKIPASGEVRGLIISDAQWGRMFVVRSQKPVDSEKMPE